MRNYILLSILLSFSLFTLSACGGGGSDTKSTATVKISLNGSIDTDSIGGAEFTLTLPANVTPVTSNGTTVANNIVMPSATFAGTTFSPDVTYTPATGATAGSLKVLITSSAPAGITTVGEIATITLQLSNGATPAAADFPVSSASVIKHPSGVAIAGMSASVSNVTLQ